MQWGPGVQSRQLSDASTLRAMSPRCGADRVRYGIERMRAVFQRQRGVPPERLRHCFLIFAEPGLGAAGLGRDAQCPA